jgi:Na+-transporting methylmalonyl-CoA/oxaloacetate decarboxylase gamma subunit
MRATLAFLLVLIVTIVFANNDNIRINVVMNAPPAEGGGSAGTTPSGYGTFSLQNIIGMCIAIAALVVFIVIILAAAHFGRREIEKETEAVIRRQKEEEEKYERARVYELTRIGV